MGLTLLVTGLLHTASLPDSRPLKFWPTGVARLTAQLPLGVDRAAVPTVLSNVPGVRMLIARVVATLAALDDSAAPSRTPVVPDRLSRVAPPVIAALTPTVPPLISAAVPVPAVGA